MTLISFNWTSSLAADSVKLSDALDSYGVRRADTLELIVADGTPMDDQGGGLYTYEFEEIDGVEYEYVIEVESGLSVFRFVQRVGGVDGSEVSGDTIKMLKFGLIKSGAFVAADAPPKLSNPSMTYGVVRLDTEGVVVLDGSDFGTIGIGMYARGFIEPEENLRYRYYIEVIVDGVTYYLSRTTEYVSSAALVIGRYTNSEEIAKYFNSDNVHKWVGVSDHDDPIDYAERMHAYISQAEQHIDNALRGAYSIEAFEAPVPQPIQECAMLLSGVLMYESRGVVDFNPVTGGVQHRLQFQRQRVDALLKRISLGRLKIDGLAKPVTYPIAHSVPTVFSEDPYVSDSDIEETA